MDERGIIGNRKRGGISTLDAGFSVVLKLFLKNIDIGGGCTDQGRGNIDSGNFTDPTLHGKQQGPAFAASDINKVIVRPCMQKPEQPWQHETVCRLIRVRVSTNAGELVQVDRLMRLDTMSGIPAFAINLVQTVFQISKFQNAWHARLSSPVFLQAGHASFCPCARSDFSAGDSPHADGLYSAW